MRNRIYFIVVFLLSLTLHAQEAQSNQAEEKIYSLAEVDEAPQYPGGNFQAAIAKCFRVPDVEQNIDVRVYMEFVIEKDGSITGGKITRDPGFGLGEAALEALSCSEVWVPAIKNGVAVRTKFVLPVAVKIRGSKKKKKN